MEESLAAIDDGVALNDRAFERFFAIFPERKALFYNMETASRRMTDETLGMLIGLANNENWVWYQIAALVFNHRNYGALAQAEYDVFIDCIVETLAEEVGSGWSPMVDAAWREQAQSLKVMVAKAM